MKHAYEPIIVVGPGRSGTSCVAGVLQRLGVFMGERWVPADSTNPYGHWEDRDFVDLNEALIAGTITRAQWRAGIAALVEARRALGVLWGWKDPRVCDLLSDYLDFFNDPTFVRCVRRPAAIEQSFMRAYGDRWAAAEAHALLTGRIDALDQYLPWYRTLELDFDDVRKHRAESVASLSEFCGIENLPRWRRRAAIASIRAA